MRLTKFTKHTVLGHAGEVIVAARRTESGARQRAERLFNFAFLRKPNAA